MGIFLYGCVYRFAIKVFIAEAKVFGNIEFFLTELQVKIHFLELEDEVINHIVAWNLYFFVFWGYLST